jgi:hypothetical protein
MYLENRVASLEIELNKLKSHIVINDEEERSYTITKYASTPFLNSFSYSEKSDISDSFSLGYFKSSSLPSPFDQHLEPTKRGNMKVFIKDHPPVALESIPDNVIKIMMSNYMDFHLPQYPIISRPALTGILQKLLDNVESCSNFEKAIISITMAISAALITNRSEKSALSSSSALFSTMLSQILNITWESKMKKLQMTLLVAHYAFANPYAADVWHTLRDALRLCVDMGLHKEVESEVITVIDMDERRRLFMVCSGMLRHLSAVLRVKFPLPHSLISVEFPTIVDDNFITDTGIDYTAPQTKAAALHFYSFRLCETEVCEVLWHNKSIVVSIDDWITSMEQRVEDWYVKAEEFAEVKQLRFRLICKASLQIRLRRRTPRIPNPSKDSFVKLINAVAVHIDEYIRDAQNGQVSYLLMGVHYIEEAMINLLDVMWFGSDWIMDHFTLEYLSTKLQQCVYLIEKFSERWPDVRKSNMSQRLDGLREKVVSKLQKTDNISEQVYKAVSEKIEQLIFSYGHTALSTTSTTNLPNTFAIDMGEILKQSDTPSPNIVFPDKSTWQDHFIDNNVWNLDDLLDQMGDYI